MGTLTYASVKLEFEDRLLMHLQVVIVQKFRRNEAFAMSWVNSAANGSGRCAMWMVSATPILFTFHGSRVPAMNEQWLQRLTESATSSRGLIVTDENGSLVPEGPPSRGRAVPATGVTRVRASTDEVHRR